MSKKLLLNADKYCLITFPTTHSALHAEKVLESFDQPFLIVPTPREISSGCGLSVRHFCADTEVIIGVLRDNNCEVKACYQVIKEQGKNIVSAL